MICAIWRVPRSSVYARRTPAMPSSEANRSSGDALYASQSNAREGAKRPSFPKKRGPRTAMADEALLTEIRAVIAASPFHTEGHRKVRARLRSHGIRVGKHRLLGLMRTHRLLAPTCREHVHGDRAHSGTLSRRSRMLWGTDTARFYTRRDGWCWFFGAIDHCCEDIRGDRLRLTIGSSHCARQRVNSRLAHHKSAGSSVGLVSSWPLSSQRRRVGG